VCLSYNKTLVSDLNRLLSAVELLRSSAKELKTSDLCEVLITCRAKFDIKSIENDYKLWAELVTEGLRKDCDSLPKYEFRW
jgi:hypothetical protein